MSQNSGQVRVRVCKVKKLLFNFEGSERKLQKLEKLMESNGNPKSLKNGGVAQLGEHLPCTQGVRSSILLISTSKSRDLQKG